MKAIYCILILTILGCASLSTAFQIKDEVKLVSDSVASDSKSSHEAAVDYIEELKKSFKGLDAKIPAAPVLLLYPMHQECEWRVYNYLEQTLNTYVRCQEVATDETWLVNRVYDVKAHGETLCAQIEQDDNLKNGNFSIVSMSTGGILARYVIEYCPFKHPIRNVVTMGGPMNGVSAVQHEDRSTMVGGVVDWVVDRLIKYDFMDRVLEPADFWRDPTDYDSYLTYSRFLAEANNEVNPEAERKEAWQHLNNALFIKFSEDDTIIPNESSWWGQYDEHFNVQCRHETTVYEKDMIGIKSLEEEQKAHFIEWPGAHMQFNFTQINDHVLPILRS
jgi:palmitoyl-protein thioesterase